eukprot:6197928-Pleurochrysis_carterae.AAC.1
MAETGLVLAQGGAERDSRERERRARGGRAKKGGECHGQTLHPFSPVQLFAAHLVRAVSSMSPTRASASSSSQLRLLSLSPEPCLLLHRRCRSTWCSLRHARFVSPTST